MTRPLRPILASVALVATLGGCHREQKATGHGTISGEILPGSVSDAMLPYDSVKSKAPTAPVEAIDPAADKTPGDNSADSAETSPADSAAPDAVAPASPAATAVGN